MTFHNDSDVQRALESAEISADNAMVSEARVDRFVAALQRMRRDSSEAARIDQLIAEVTATPPDASMLASAEEVVQLRAAVEESSRSLKVTSSRLAQLERAVQDLKDDEPGEPNEPDDLDELELPVRRGPRQSSWSTRPLQRWWHNVPLLGVVALVADQSTSLAALVLTLASALSMLIIIGIYSVVVWISSRELIRKGGAAAVLHALSGWQVVPLLGAIALVATRSTALTALVVTLASAFSMLIIIGVNSAVVWRSSRELIRKGGAAAVLHALGGAQRSVAARPASSSKRVKDRARSST